MDARATRMATGRRGAGTRVLAMLALVGALVQACSDNKGPSGPKFPAGQTGTSDAGIVVFLGVNPNTIERGRRAGVTVVARTPNGRGIPGLHVQLSTTAGRLDTVDGFTDVDGKFVTFLFVPCEVPAGSATVSAIVEGADSLGAADVTFIDGGANAPCPPSVTAGGGTTTTAGTP